METRFKEVTTLMRLHRVLHDVNQLLIFVMFFYFVLFCIKPELHSGLINVALTGIGYHVLMAEAMMTHYPCNLFTHSLSYNVKSQVHGVLQLVSILMVLFGEYRKIINTEWELSYSRIMFGYMSMCLCFAGFFGGFINFFQPRQILQCVLLLQLKFLHNFYGLFVFTVGMMTVSWDYQLDIFFEEGDYLLPIAAFIALVLAYKLDILSLYNRKVNTFYGAMSVIVLGFYLKSVKETITIFVYLVTMITPLKSLIYKLNKDYL